MTLHAIALILSIMLLVYHQLTTWLPIYPWNDIANFSRKDILMEAGWNGVLMALGCFCLFHNNASFYGYYPLIYYPFLLWGEFMQWWLPYFSPGFAKSKHNFDYEPRYTHTLKLLPHKTGQRTPDANHTVLHVLTLIMVIFVFLNHFL